MTARTPASPLSRRRLLAVSGATLAAGSSAVLAACGAAADDEEASPEEDAAALNEILAQQLGVIEAVEAGLGALPTTVKQPVFALRTERLRSSKDLAETIGELGGAATTEAAPQAAQAESAVEGVARQLEASIAGSLAAIGDLSSERRQPVARAIFEDAAVLAVLRSELGEDVAPDAFVFGAAAGEAS